VFDGLFTSASRKRKITATSRKKERSQEFCPLPDGLRIEIIFSLRISISRGLDRQGRLLFFRKLLTSALEVSPVIKIIFPSRAGTFCNKYA
jgi:hypothetical protein